MNKNVAPQRWFCIWNQWLARKCAMLPMVPSEPKGRMQWNQRMSQWEWDGTRGWANGNAMSLNHEPMKIWANGNKPMGMWQHLPVDKWLTVFHWVTNEQAISKKQRSMIDQWESSSLRTDCSWLSQSRWGWEGRRGRGGKVRERRKSNGSPGTKQSIV